MPTLQSVPALGTHPANGSAAFHAKAVGRAETREQLSKSTYDLLVIGGGILGGGGGTVFGVLGGVLALAAVDNVLNLSNVESYYQQCLKGLIILVAVLARRKKV